MSWSIGVENKASLAAEIIENNFKRMPIETEPEESIKQSAMATIAETLDWMASDTVVKVTASGNGATLHIAIEPQ